MSDITVREVHFNGDTLLAAQASDTSKVYVAIKWVCQGLGLDDRRQKEKIQEHMTLSKGVATLPLPTSGGPQETMVIDIEFLPLWLAGLNPSLVGGKAKGKLLEYQLKAKDVLAQAFLSQQPMAVTTPTEALLQAVQILAQQEKEIKSLKAARVEQDRKLEVVSHRVDSLDAVNIGGDLRQRLNRMVQKYARKKGILFNVAWHDFKHAFNTAFRTNLELLILNFEKKTGMKNVTIPQYLAATGKLEDGIRVADKLLNAA